MTKAQQELRDLVAEQAADWFVANRESPTPASKAAFVEWLRTSRLHVEEYLAIAGLAHALPSTRDGDAPDLAPLIEAARADEPRVMRLAPPAQRPSARTRWPMALAAAASLAVVGVATVLVLGQRSAPTAAARVAAAGDFRTARGELRTVSLADRSVVRLDADSALSVAFTPTERTVRLTAGRANFDVRHEPRRAFVVQAGDAIVQAVGTAFDVRIDGRASVVTLYQGRLRISSASGGDARLIEAGQRLRIEPGVWPATPVSFDALHESAWMRHQLVVERQPLADVARELNRYSPQPLRIQGRELQELRVSGVFATGDVDSFVAFLRSLPGVRVERVDGEIRVTDRSDAETSSP
jgi:transmembrane sensor